jgi:hypothetical protein
MFRSFILSGRYQHYIPNQVLIERITVRKLQLHLMQMLIEPRYMRKEGKYVGGKPIIVDHCDVTADQLHKTAEIDPRIDGEGTGTDGERKSKSPRWGVSTRYSLMRLHTRTPVCAHSHTLVRSCVCSHTRIPSLPFCHQRNATPLVVFSQMRRRRDREWEKRRAALQACSYKLAHLSCKARELHFAYTLREAARIFRRGAVELFGSSDSQGCTQQQKGECEMRVLTYTSLRSPVLAHHHALLCSLASTPLVQSLVNGVFCTSTVRVKIQVFALVYNFHQHALLLAPLSLQDCLLMLHSSSLYFGLGH